MLFGTMTIVRRVPSPPAACPPVDKMASIILSSDVFNAKSGTVIAVAVTSQKPKAGFPLTLSLGETEIPKKSWVKISQIRTLSVDRITGKIGHATDEIVAQVVEGLNEILATR